MSSKYDRLVEAWVAGRLTEAEERELFRSAEVDGDLARLLNEQKNVRSGIDADRAGLRDRLMDAGLRARVADLSKTIGVEGGMSLAGAGRRTGISGVARWIAGVLLVGGAALGIYLAGDAADSQASNRAGDAKPSVETVSPSGSTSVRKGVGIEKMGESAVPQDREASQREIIPMEENSRESAPHASASGVDSTKGPSIVGNPNDATWRSNNEIKVSTEIEGTDKLP